MSTKSLCINAEETEPQIAPIFASLPPALAARAVTLAAAAMREDPTCWRAPKPRHYAGAHKNSEREALTLNLPRHIVSLTPPWRKRLHALATSLQETCAAGESRDACDAGISGRAERLIAKAAHMSLSDLEAQALVIASLHRKHVFEMRERAKRAVQIFDERSIAATNGATWRLITTCVQLVDAGAALHNCWAADRPFSARYQDYMRAKQAEFWVLTGPDGAKPTRALMLDLKSNAVVEVRGPSNQEVWPGDEDVLTFMEARACLMTVTVLNTRLSIDHTKVRELLALIARAPEKPQSKTRRRGHSPKAAPPRPSEVTA